MPRSLIASLQQVFTVRTRNIFRHQAERAAKADAELDYDLDALRKWVRAAFEAEAGCCYCRDPLDLRTVSVDHAVPVARGGPHARANLRLCCTRCNQAKGQLTETEFRGLLVAMKAWDEKARDNTLRRLRAGSRVIRN